MSTTTAPDPVDALRASPVPFDLFREVHKGLRLAMFDVTEVVGAAGCGDPAERAEIAGRVHALIALLHLHHGHEDSFVEPLLVAREPTLAHAVHAGHVEVDGLLDELARSADDLAVATDGVAVATNLDLYRKLALFTATYLAHMELEEGRVMAALREAMTLEELFHVEMTLRGA